MANETVKCFRREDRPRSLGAAIVFQAAFILNVGVALALNRGSEFPKFRALLSFPGAYLWLGAFGLLALLATAAHRTFFFGLFTRLVSVGLVAILVAAVLFAFLYAVSF